jgi:hypothetical protein
MPDANLLPPAETTTEPSPLELQIEKLGATAMEVIHIERARMQHLLKQIGAPDHCNGCGAAILWVRHRNGNAAPYDANGQPHFASCPKASQFRKRPSPVR